MISCIYKSDKQRYEWCKIVIPANKEDSNTLVYQS